VTADDERVTAFWREHRLTHGSRDERLHADTTASDAIRERIEDDPVAALGLLEKLMGAPGADLPFLGAWALEDLLAEHADLVAEAVAECCRNSSVWREALGTAPGLVDPGGGWGSGRVSGL
jgi:hypothetical protein